jgi:hypothetical protein
MIRRGIGTDKRQSDCTDIKRDCTDNVRGKEAYDRGACVGCR